ncbi:MAG: hypothetical protein JSV34_02540 [Candidatus Omnitrophota bacterium]|nr:MAG: hypothetical protein JSV34_02540 [Candidatus Omnitrophota bacterium]
MKNFHKKFIKDIVMVLATIASFLSNRDVRTRLRYAENELEAMKIIREHSSK